MEGSLPEGQRNSRSEAENTDDAKEHRAKHKTIA